MVHAGGVIGRNALSRRLRQRQHLQPQSLRSLRSALGLRHSSSDGGGSPLGLRRTLRLGLRGEPRRLGLSSWPENACYQISEGRKESDHPSETSRVGPPGQAGWPPVATTPMVPAIPASMGSTQRPLLPTRQTVHTPPACHPSHAWHIAGWWPLRDADNDNEGVIENPGPAPGASRQGRKHRRRRGVPP